MSQTRLSAALCRKALGLPETASDMRCRDRLRDLSDHLYDIQYKALMLILVQVAINFPELDKRQQRKIARSLLNQQEDLAALKHLIRRLGRYFACRRQRMFR